MQGAELAPGTPQLAVGTELGDYVIEELLGAGSEGMVYRARDAVLGRRVALKTFRQGSPLQTRCVEEARMLSRLDHPNVIRVFHVRRHNRIWYVALEYAACGNLYSYVREHGPLEPKAALSLCAQLVDGLMHVHAAGIIHRDIKPQNLLLCTERQVKISDLGLALEVRAEGSRSPAMVGTPAFLAPERWDEGALAPSSDVYSLGVCAFYLLTGRLPFNAPDPAQLRREHESLEPVMPSSCPRGARDIVLGMLEKLPERRPALTSEFRRELLRLSAEPSKRMRLGTSRVQVQAVGINPDKTRENGSFRALLAPYTASYLHALRGRTPCIISGPNVSDVESFCELARDQSDIPAGHVARVNFGSNAGDLLTQLQRRTSTPPGASALQIVTELRNRLSSGQGSYLLELKAAAPLNPGQAQECGELFQAARTAGVAASLLIPSSGSPASQLSGCQGIQLPFSGETLMQLMDAWVRDATAGEYSLTRDAQHLLAFLSSTEHKSWLQLLQSSVYVAAAASQPLVASWAVQRASTGTTLADVEDVPPDHRVKPRRWPTPEILRRLTSLRAQAS